ncbi:unnamed protein product [Cercospora beticola]|nr:unnamed protein product [Cercospora beticola]
MPWYSFGRDKQPSSGPAGFRSGNEPDPRLVAFTQSLPLCWTDDERKIKEAAVSSFANHVRVLQQRARDARQQCDELQQALQNGQRKAEYEARGVRAKHAQEILRLQEDAKRDRTNLQSQHDIQIRNLNVKLHRQGEEAGREASRVKKQHEDEVQALKQHSEARENEFAREQEKLRRLHEDQEAGLRADHDRTVHELQKKLKDLNGALLSRDDEVYQAAIFSTVNLPQKTDAKLKDSFSEIENLINGISGLSWKADQTVCPENVLQRHSAKHSIRRLKKAILQDIIWSILHRFVFASPFRVFGELGKELEHEWVANSVGNPQTYSQRHPNQDEAARTVDTFLPDAGSYKWPAPSPATERWRYMTLQECREVLKQPVLSQFDPRARLKKGFSDTISSLAAELTTTIQKVASVDNQSMDNVNTLSRKVPKAWLDFCMHRPRIVVDMFGQEFSGASQRFSQIGRGEVLLTVVPKLGRYGDIEGADLDRFNLLKDGESLTLP